jgi:branched-chain amino acid transport system ATP-binding protein
MTMLSVNGVSIRFGGIAALKDVSFDVAAGEIVSVIGPNGAGKTTLFNMISGFGKPDTGVVQFEGRPITGLPANKIAGLGLVRTFQKTEVFPELSVSECVRIGRLNTLNAGLVQRFFGSPEVRDFVAGSEKAVDDVLAAVGLLQKRARLARSLSYGEQRLLEVAVGMAARPRLLMLDEPASGLNRDEAQRFSALIRTLRTRGFTLVLVEHNMNVVMSVSDRIVVLHHGEKLFEGTPEEVRAHPSVIAAYLGKEWSTDAAA